MEVRASRRMTLGMVALALAACMAREAVAAYVITKQNKRIEGTDIRAKANGEIVLTTPQGTRTFYPGQYLKAVADKPADYDRAVQLVNAGKYAEAVEILQGIVRRFRYLEWDQRARALLAKAYAARGQHGKAVDIFEEMFRIDSSLAENRELQWAYRRQLLAAGKYAELSRILTEVVTRGDRPDAARAYLMRGDLKMARNQVESAALDYLRTVILFKDQEDVQPMALFKAAEALEKLLDARARQLYEKLVKEYPSSPYAAKAKRKI
ncbi:MAG TPA: tetratricopeptide repeat protein [Kiritimatiellae bacterium]|nr:tetratricopeptide repeat protein [Kiritimatiellia bacterium]